MTVTVSPEQFTMVDFDATVIAAIAERLATELGLPPDLAVSISVDEATPMGRARVESVDPAVITVEGGALENPKRIRQLGKARVVDVLGLLLHQLRDRLDPSFGAPAVDEQLPQPHKVAWEVYAAGRVAGLGYDAQRQRRLYHFRNRHGFTDAADAAFDQLWGAQNIGWNDITRLSDEALAAKPGPVG